jgi:hypothetical protein
VRWVRPAELSAGADARLRVTVDGPAAAVTDDAAVGIDLGTALDACRALGARAAGDGRALIRRHEPAGLTARAGAALDGATATVTFDTTLLARAGLLLGLAYADLPDARADVGLDQAAHLVVGAAAALDDRAAAVGDGAAVLALRLAGRRRAVAGGGAAVAVSDQVTAAALGAARRAGVP